MTTTPPRVLGVAGAAGGVGTTVLATALAVAATARTRCVVETRRGGLDVVCGVEDLPGARLDDLGDLDGTPDGTRLLAALPQRHGVGVLAHVASQAGPPLDAERSRRVVAALGSAAGLVVVDLGTAPAPPDVDAVVLVVRPEAHRLTRALGWCDALDADTRNRTTCVLVGPGPDPALLAEHLGLPAGLRVRHDRGLARDLDAAALPGRRGVLARDAAAVLERFGVGAAPRRRVVRRDPR